MMQTDYTKALYEINQISVHDSADDSERAYWGLLRTQVLDKNYRISEADEDQIKYAVEYFEKYGSIEKKIRSNFYNGAYLMSQNSYRDAMMSAMIAYEQAKEYGDYYWQAKTNELIADLLSETYNRSEVIPYARKSVYYYKLANKPANYRWALCDLAISYANADSIEKALDMLRTLTYYGQEVWQDSAFVGACMENIISVSVDKGDIESAKKWLNKLSEYEGKFIEDGYFDAYREYILFTDSVCHENNRSEKLLYTKKLTEKIQFYLNLVQWNAKKGNYKTALLYEDTLLTLQNKIVKDLLMQSTMSAQRDYFISQSIRSKYEADRLKKTLIIGSICSIIVILSSFYIYRLKIKIKNSEIDSRISDIKSLSDKIQNIEIETEEITHALEDKNRICSTLSILAGCQMRNSWATLNNLCNEYFEKGDNKNTRLSIVKDVEKEIDRVKSPQNLLEIEKSVNACFNDIMVRLREQCDFLKKRDCDFIMLIYAGLSPRAICIFTNIKLKYFYTKRSRLIERIQRSNVHDKCVFIENMLLK